MSTGLISHPACLAHDPGPDHPECPDRLRAVRQALEDEAFALLDRARATPASEDQLLRVHSAAHVARILAIRPEGGRRVQIDPDTMMSAGSAEAALLAAGGAVAAVEAVLARRMRNCFVAVRPPGHHAGPDTAEGFCLFNNAAIAAAHARAAGLRRVAIVDFDVHHGNGTQDIVAADPDLFYGSSHQAGAYPGTGFAEETGVGNIVNTPLRAGTDGAGFRAAWDERILPALDAFCPELLIISAGFDAHRADPLAQLRLGNEDFAWITRALMEVAQTHAGGRVVSVLEGGYDLDALAASAAAHVRALMEG